MMFKHNVFLQLYIILYLGGCFFILFAVVPTAWCT